MAMLEVVTEGDTEDPRHSRVPGNSVSGTDDVSQVQLVGQIARPH